MKEKIKCYHLDDEDFTMRKSSFYGRYEKRRYWGTIVTNKAKRNPSKFASLIDPKGTIAHQITHATFKMLAPFCEHIYPISLTDKEVCKIMEGAGALEPDDLHTILKALSKNRCFRDIVSGLIPTQHEFDC